MTQLAIVEPTRAKSVLLDMADRYGMEASAFEATLRNTVVPANCSKEQFAAFLLVAKEYRLNPLLKEIYAFPTRGGGIQPVVGIDGWANLINSHTAFDGMEFEDHVENGELKSIACKMFRKDRTHPISATEYMAECKRQTDPWKQWPRRMLRHKAMIQAARYAFSFAGIVDPDEAERIAADLAHDVTPRVPLAERLSGGSLIITTGETGFSQQRVIAEVDGAETLTRPDARNGGAVASQDGAGPRLPPEMPPASSALQHDAGNLSNSPETNEGGAASEPEKQNPDQMQDKGVQAAGFDAKAGGLPSDWARRYAEALMKAKPQTMARAASAFWTSIGVRFADIKDSADGELAIGVYDACRLPVPDRDAQLTELGAI